MIKLLLAAFIAAATPAPDGTACVDRAYLETVMADISYTEADVRGPMASAVIDQINAIPPVSAVTGDQVVVYRLLKEPRVVAVIFTRGCATAWFMLPAGVLRLGTAV